MFADAGAYREMVANGPDGWMFQHDETGRMTTCENDGINNKDNFAKNNPRWQYVGELYALPATAPAKSEG